MFLLAGNTAASSQQKQNPVTQLSVTGVSIALMSSQPIPAAAAGVVPAPSTIGNCRPALAADLAACLLEEGWQQAHVVLKQWQCSIDVRSPSSRSASRPASTQAAEQAATVDQQLAAILMYKPAGVAEVSCSSSMRCLCQLLLFATETSTSTCSICTPFTVLRTWYCACGCNIAATESCCLLCTCCCRLMVALWATLPGENCNQELESLVAPAAAAIPISQAAAAAAAAAQLGCVLT